MPRLVVIGGVAAGLSAAARARRLDPSLEILVLEKGSVISYGACGLPYWIEGRVARAEDLIVYTPEQFSRERNITVRTGAEVAGISHPRREVVLAGGDRIAYDRLVIATGARPDRSGVETGGRDNVFSLHTLEDACRLREFLRLRRPQRACVVGAGYIGMEAAEALRANGLAVTMFTRGENLLNRDDAGLSAILRAQLERFRVEVRTSTTVHSLDGMPYDLFLLATGLKPNVEIAAAAGIETGRTGAIAASDRMETNIWGIWAAGDCAETRHLVTGRPVWIPLGTTANKMGRIAGAAAAGARETFPGIVGTSIVRVCGLGVGTTGLSVSHARREGFDPVSARIRGHDRARYFFGKTTTVELVADRRSRRLLGGTVTGYNGVEGRVNVIAAALSNRMRADEFEQLDLAYAPPFAPVWDPVLIAAQQLSKLLD